LPLADFDMLRRHGITCVYKPVSDFIDGYTVCRLLENPLNNFSGGGVDYRLAVVAFDIPINHVAWNLLSAYHPLALWAVKVVYERVQRWFCGR
jgi:hypothetical protein